MKKLAYLYVILFVVNITPFANIIICNKTGFDASLKYTTFKKHSSGVGIKSEIEKDHFGSTKRTVFNKDSTKSSISYKGGVKYFQPFDNKIKANECLELKCPISRALLSKFGAGVKIYEANLFQKDVLNSVLSINKDWHPSITDVLLSFLPTKHSYDRKFILEYNQDGSIKYADLLLDDEHGITINER